jgi:hypothetical protein
MIYFDAFSSREPVSTSLENAIDCRDGCDRGKKTKMVTDHSSSDIGRFMTRIVIDDRSRLPGRFFGRFATSAV